jgi:hypothetical protein
LPSQSNICPFLDIEFNKTFGLSKKLVVCSHWLFCV